VMAAHLKRANIDLPIIEGAAVAKSIPNQTRKGFGNAKREEVAFLIVSGPPHNEVARRSGASSGGRSSIVDVSSRPPRMTTRKTLKLARFSAATLKRRQDEGLFPRPIERNIYLREEVLLALGLATSPVTDDKDFQDAPDAFRQNRTARKR
jgi:hypothetical protein